MHWAAWTWAALLAMSAPPGFAQAFTCSMVPCTNCTDHPVTVSFVIDESQFVAPQHKRDPPRRKVTYVQADAQRYYAEPIMLGKVRGFWAESVKVMFIVQPDQSAKLTGNETRLQSSGQCVITD